jgi:hypothetical protein
MRLTVTSHLTLDGVMQSNEKPSLQVDSRLTDGWQTASAGTLTGGVAPAWRHPLPFRCATLGPCVLHGCFLLSRAS